MRKKKKKHSEKLIKNPEYQDRRDFTTPLNLPKPSQEEQKKMEEFFWYGVSVGLYR